MVEPGRANHGLRCSSEYVTDVALFALAFSTYKSNKLCSLFSLQSRRQVQVKQMLPAAIVQRIVFTGSILQSIGTRQYIFLLPYLTK